MAKKEAYKVKPMTEEKRNIIAGLIHEYDIQSAFNNPSSTQLLR